jgi:hypothetical protein
MRPVSNTIRPQLGAFAPPPERAHRRTGRGQEPPSPGGGLLCEGSRRARHLGPMLGAWRRSAILAVGTDSTRTVEERRAGPALGLDGHRRSGNCADCARAAQPNRQRGRRVGDSLGQPDKVRFRLFDSFIGFFAAAAETQPLLIVLDDLHPADPTSLLMRIAFSRQVRSMRAAAIGTYRTLEVKQLPEDAALIAQAEREGVAFALLGLDDGAIGKFIESA